MGDDPRQGRGVDLGRSWDGGAPAGKGPVAAVVAEAGAARRRRGGVGPRLRARGQRDRGGIADLDPGEERGCEGGLVGDEDGGRRGGSRRGPRGHSRSDPDRGKRETWGVGGECAVRVSGMRGYGEAGWAKGELGRPGRS